MVEVRGNTGGLQTSLVKSLSNLFFYSEVKLKVTISVSLEQSFLLLNLLTSHMDSYEVVFVFSESVPNEAIARRYFISLLKFRLIIKLFCPKETSKVRKFFNLE